MKREREKKHNARIWYDWYWEIYGDLLWNVCVWFEAIPLDGVKYILRLNWLWCKTDLKDKWIRECASDFKENLSLSLSHLLLLSLRPQKTDTRFTAIEFRKSSRGNHIDWMIDFDQIEFSTRSRYQMLPLKRHSLSRSLHKATIKFGFNFILEFYVRIICNGNK